MKPIEFEGVDVTYAKGQSEYLPLPTQWINENTILTCWELTDEEIKVLKKTKKLWLGVMTFRNPLQPLLLSTNKEEIIEASI